MAQVQSPQEEEEASLLSQTTTVSQFLHTVIQALLTWLLVYTKDSLPLQMCSQVSLLLPINPLALCV